MSISDYIRKKKKNNVLWTSLPQSEMYESEVCECPNPVRVSARFFIGVKSCMFHSLLFYLWYWYRGMWGILWIGGWYRDQISVSIRYPFLNESVGIWSKWITGMSPPLCLVRVVGVPVISLSLTLPLWFPPGLPPVIITGLSRASRSGWVMRHGCYPFTSMALYNLTKNHWVISKTVE